MANTKSGARNIDCAGGLRLHLACILTCKLPSSVSSFSLKSMMYGPLASELCSSHVR